MWSTLFKFGQFCQNNLYFLDYLGCGKFNAKLSVELLT